MSSFLAGERYTCGRPNASPGRRVEGAPRPIEMRSAPPWHSELSLVHSVPPIMNARARTRLPYLHGTERLLGRLGLLLQLRVALHEGVQALLRGGVLILQRDEARLHIVENLLRVDRRRALLRLLAPNESLRLRHDPKTTLLLRPRQILRGEERARHPGGHTPTSQHALHAQKALQAC